MSKENERRRFPGAVLVRLKFVTLLCIGLVVGRAQYQSQSFSPDSRGDVAIQTSPIQDPPPTPSPTPEEDTARYLEWMNERGAPIKDQARENVSLRIGDWGFFYHGGDRPPGSWRPLLDRVALDRSGHAVTEAEHGDWYALLCTSGLEAAGALKRVAWLFNAGGIDPASKPGEAKRAKITAPTLTTNSGVITFQGWWEAYTDPPYSRRITIVATRDRTKLVIDSGEKP